MLTPERVSLQYDIAGIGSRGAAVLIDTALQLAALVVVGLLVGVVGGLGSRLPVDRDAFFIGLGALFLLAMLAVTTGYFMLFEVIWNGQSPGKRIVGVRVMRENGYPERTVDAVIRNLVRMVDWLPIGYGVGVLVMLLNRRSRRLGDFAAGTIVVREGQALAAPPIPVPLAVDAPGSTPGYRLSAADATLVRDFLARRPRMDPAARADLAGRLAETLAARYGLVRERDPEAFLEALAG